MAGAVDDHFQFGLFPRGYLELIQRLPKIVQNASHSVPVIFQSLCDSAIDLPVYFCGPPVAQQTISVTRYLNPAGGTRWCACPPGDWSLVLGPP